MWQKLSFFPLCFIVLYCALLCFIVLYCALLCFIVLIILNFALSFLKGVFAKNERVYSFTSKNYRWLLILLLSAASLMRKWLKTTYTEERSVHTNSASWSIRLGSKKKTIYSCFLLTFCFPSLASGIFSRSSLMTSNSPLIKGSSSSWVLKYSEKN